MSSAIPEQGDSSVRVIVRRDEIVIMKTVSVKEETGGELIYGDATGHHCDLF